MKLLLIVMALALGGLRGFSSAQECSALASHSSSDAIAYLQKVTGDARTAPCVSVAFREIASLPTTQSVPVLIQYLGYERPLTELEKQGVFMTSDPGKLYPAILALFNLGRDAVEPSLISFLEQYSGGQQTFDNAVFLLNALRHGNTPAAMEDLKARRVGTTDQATVRKLRIAAKALMKWCDPAWKEKCEAALQ